METLEIKIDSLSYGGNGVGRHEGIVYFVPLSVPGDLLEVRITKKEKRYREAEIIRIIEASPDRIEPPCPYASECGGCQWLQVAYDRQLECKSSELRAALKKSHLEDVAERVLPIIPSPKQLGYRRTARFKVDTAQAAQAAHGAHGAQTAQADESAPSVDFGFYRTASRDLIKIDRCLLLDDRMNDYLPQVDTRKPGLAGFDLFMDESGDVHPFYRFSERDPGADFFQVNSGVNDAMLKYLSDTIRPRLSGIKKPRILDLYCGDGNLSLPFADIAASITGWDSSKTAVSRGRRHVEAAEKEHPGCRLKYFEADVARSWKNIAGHAKQTDCIILDPPRRGLKNQAARLAGLNVPLIIYISCSPPALVRDLGVLTKHGYKIDALQPFDMFPQTYHLETAAVLSK